MALKKKATDEARLDMLQCSSPLFHHSNQGTGISWGGAIGNPHKIHKSLIHFTTEFGTLSTPNE
jgi:hypothetical protein